MRTTIIIQENLLFKLKNTSEKIDISISELVGMLYNSVISEDKFEINTSSCVRYQDADPNNNWRTFHIAFEPHVYELGLDCRKFFKVSVSFLISYAIIYFLDEIMKKLLKLRQKNKYMDNYYNNYILIAKKYDNIQGFIIFWGVPEEKTLKNLIA